VHLVNTYFGHLHVLARYVGEQDRPIVGYLQHGWYEVGPLREEPQLRFVPKLLWSDRNVADARGAGVRDVVPIGAPRLYIEEGVGPDADPAGTIAYPYHSYEFDSQSHPHGNIGVRRDSSYASYHERYAAELAAREDGPITVALYWRDHEEAAARHAYESQGMRVITHGTRSERHLLDRQLAEQRRHRRVVTNRIGSALWYGALAGLEAEVYGPFAGPSPAEVRWFESFQRSHFPSLFARGGVTADEARDLASVELGARHKRSPEELAAIVGWRGWRRTVAPAVDVVDRVQHRARSGRHRRRLARRPPLWESGD